MSLAAFLFGSTRKSKAAFSNTLTRTERDVRSGSEQGAGGLEGLLFKFQPSNAQREIEFIDVAIVLSKQEPSFSRRNREKKLGK